MLIPSPDFVLLVPYALERTAGGPGARKRKGRAIRSFSFDPGAGLVCDHIGYPHIADGHLEEVKTEGGDPPKEAAMTRSKFSIKAALLAGGIGLSMVGFAGSQPAAAQSYSNGYACPAGYVYDPAYGCTLPGEIYDADGTYDPYAPFAPYDYGDYGYVPYGGYGSYNDGHRDFGHGFGHGMGGSFDHGGIGAAHFGGGMAGGFHGGGFGGGHR
jgi:hypothetical protein